MRVGNSPLYFLPGQESMLERFSNHLKSKEKDAFLLLKGKKILKDSEQNPAIRVALRSIRDFAIPFKKDGDIFWRYFSVPEAYVEERSKEERKKAVDLGIFEKSEKPETKRKTVKRRRVTKKKNDIFFNKVKEFLSKNSMMLVEIESLSKNELILKIKSKGKEGLLFAYNKKRITDTDIIKAGKKAEEFGLPYILLSKGGPLKKIENIIKAIKNLESIETLK
jgi:hypothetical protein